MIMICFIVRWFQVRSYCMARRASAFCWEINLINGNFSEDWGSIPGLDNKLNLFNTAN